MHCNDDCQFEQVWLGFAAADVTKRPLVEPAHGVDIVPSDFRPCMPCDRIAIPVWTGCDRIDGVARSKGHQCVLWSGTQPTHGMGACSGWEW